MEHEDATTIHPARCLPGSAAELLNLLLARPHVLSAARVSVGCERTSLGKRTALAAKSESKTRTRKLTHVLGGAGKCFRSASARKWKIAWMSGPTSQRCVRKSSGTA